MSPAEIKAAFARLSPTIAAAGTLRGPSQEQQAAALIEVVVLAEGLLVNIARIAEALEYIPMHGVTVTSA